MNKWTILSADGNEKRKLIVIGALKSEKALIVSIILTVVPILLAFAISWKIPNVSSDLTIFVASVGVFLTALYQWAEGRKEITLDKYFDRRDLVNSRLDQWPHARSMVGHFWGKANDIAIYQKRMYVYCELDNIEYILEKHQIGFVSEIHAWRGVETFISRCRSSEFREIARESISDSGYTHYTKRIVNNIIVLCEGEWGK